MPTTRNRWQDETQPSEPLGILPAGRKMASSVSDLEAATLTSISEIVDKPASAQIMDSDPVASSAQRQHEPQPDENPRSPKRPRLSPIDDMEDPQMAPSKVSGSPTSPPVQPSTAPTINATTSAKAVLPPAPKNHSPEPTNGNNVRLPMSMPGQGSASRSGTSTPTPQIRVDNLASLSTLADQLLAVLARMNQYELGSLNANSPSPNHHEYTRIRKLFNPLLNLYRTGPSFIIPQQIGLTNPAQIETLRKANQALWLTSIFTGEIGLRDMDLSFLFVFVPEQGVLSKPQGSIFLELKTQALLTAHRLRVADPRIVLEELFSKDIDQQMMSRRSGTRSLAASEQDSLRRLTARKDALMEAIRLNQLDQSANKFLWGEFTREVINYIHKNFGLPQVATGSIAQQSTDNDAQLASQPTQTQMQRAFTLPEISASSNTDKTPSNMQRPLHTYPRLIPNNRDDWMAQLSQAYETAMKPYLVPAEPASQAQPAMPLDDNVKLPVPATPPPAVQPSSTTSKANTVKLSTATSSDEDPKPQVIPHATDETSVKQEGEAKDVISIKTPDPGHETGPGADEGNNTNVTTQMEVDDDIVSKQQEGH